MLGFISRDEIIDSVKELGEWTKLPSLKSAAKIKSLVANAMAAKGRPLSDKTTVEGKQWCNVFKDCAWKSPFPEENGDDGP